MTFKIASIIYRLGMGLVLIASFVGNILTAEGGHNKSFTASDYTIFVHAILTIFLLSLYESISTEDYPVFRKILLYPLIILVLASIGFEIYDLYDTFFICKCFTTGDNMITSLECIFLLVTIIVLYSLGSALFKLTKLRSANNDI